MDALLLSIYEGRDLAAADMAGAYLKTYMDDLVLMKFMRELVNMLCKLNPQHKRFVVTENGIKVLYVQKAIYGCIKSALCGMKCSLPG
jgi:hypothetical protein